MFVGYFFCLVLVIPHGTVELLIHTEHADLVEDTLLHSTSTCAQPRLLRPLAWVGLGVLFLPSLLGSDSLGGITWRRCVVAAHCSQGKIGCGVSLKNHRITEL